MFLGKGSRPTHTPLRFPPGIKSWIKFWIKLSSPGLSWEAMLKTIGELVSN